MKIVSSRYTPLAVKKIFFVLFIGLLSGTGCSLQKTQAVGVSDQQTQTVGWVEKAIIPGVEEEVKVKLDTGAKTTSINAEILEKPDEKSEAGGMIKFRFIDGKKNGEVFERLSRCSRYSGNCLSWCSSNGNVASSHAGFGRESEFT